MNAELSPRERLLHQLDRSRRLRADVAADPRLSDRRAALRAWQAVRLGRTHGDLLRNPRFHQAAQFFLTDLYGPHDLGQHLEGLGGVVPAMARVLPEAGLVTVAHAVELNAISEDFDAAMAVALGDRIEAIDEAAYGAAYRRVGRLADRERQIDLIALLGESLDALTRQRLIGAALKLMRKPAHLAGLGELQWFLERGYSAFGAMRGGAGDFVRTVVARERRIAEALMAGDDGALHRPPEP